MLKYTTLFILIPSIAHAGCELSTTPCSQDRYGNTYRTEQNLGGGYNTYRNGQLDSQTKQNLGGGYTTDYRDGSPSQNHNYNPYNSKTLDSVETFQNKYDRR